MIRSTWPLSGNAYGCYYHNDYEPAVYTKHKKNDISVSVRYYMDSFIAADELTGGCSSSSPSSSSCFGMSRSEQNKTGAIVTLVGLLLTGLEVGLVIFSCICCRDTVTGAFGRKKNGLLDHQAPYAPSQPGYVPTAQPAYVPSQPSYAPSQPSFIPTAQPTYGTPGQSTYGTPAQPTYNAPGYTPSTYGVPQ